MSSEVWDERADAWDEQEATHVYAAQAFETLGPQVGAHLGGWDGLRVLDFGAGTGLLTAKLAPRCREVVALDLSPKMIAQLDKKAASEGWDNVSSFAGPLSALKETAAFDLIVASSVCSFLPDFTGALRQLSSRLRPGGLFVQWDWRESAADDWRKSGAGEGSGGFSEQDLRHAYASAKLDVLRADLGFTFVFDDDELDVLMGVGKKA